MAHTRAHIISFVFSKVEGENRIIRTAQAAINGGREATIVGVASAAEAVEGESRSPIFGSLKKKLTKLLAELNVIAQSVALTVWLTRRWRSISAKVERYSLEPLEWRALLT